MFSTTALHAYVTRKLQEATENKSFARMISAACLCAGGGMLNVKQKTYYQLVEVWNID